MNKEQQIEEMAVIGCVRNPQAPKSIKKNRRRNKNERVRNLVLCGGIDE